MLWKLTRKDYAPYAELEQLWTISEVTEHSINGAELNDVETHHQGRANSGCDGAHTDTQYELVGTQT